MITTKQIASKIVKIFQNHHLAQSTRLDSIQVEIENLILDIKNKKHKTIKFSGLNSSESNKYKNEWKLVLKNNKYEYKE